MNKTIKIIILSLIVFSSLMFEMTKISVDMGTAYVYVIKPMMWILIGIVSFIFFKNETNPNYKYKKDVNFIVTVTLLLYFFIYFIFGYIVGFANNPYDSSFKGILSNIWTFIPIIYVREYIRHYMINNCNEKHILWWTLFMSILFSLVEINMYKLDSYFENAITTTEFLMQTFIPTLVINLYLTYISYFSGYNTSFLYAAIPQIATYALPILPNIDLSTLSILNSVVPFCSYLYINHMVNKADKIYNRKEYKPIGIKGWIGTIAIIVLVVCFGYGVFPVEPLVIASNSMAPNIYKGDMVIIIDGDPKEVKEGEVIRYKMDGYYVVHRVKEIKEDKDGNKLFITKGDNNDDVDLYPVKESQYDGTIKVNIPYIGYPTLIFNELINGNLSQNINVETGK